MLAIEARRILIRGFPSTGLQCDTRRGTGVPPVSLAEFNLDDNGQDWYDISFVDGYNLPISISNNKGCPSPGCRVDLGPNCPAPLKGPFDSSGFPVGCKSACSANLDGNPTNSRNCCSGQYSTPQTCPPSGVQYYSYFKNACPNAYAYVRYCIGYPIDLLTSCAATPTTSPLIRRSGPALPTSWPTTPSPSARRKWPALRLDLMNAQHAQMYSVY